MIERKAYAKINLCLEVIGKRSDNYHDLTTVMQMVDLYDTLRFEPAPGEELTLTCDDPALAADGQSNLVLRAARLLREHAGTEEGAHIHLEKRIPVAAGLGGGSSDAAAALLGLCDLWGINVRRGDLAALAIQLGSDVPFFLHGPTALVEGRGDKVTRIPSMPQGVVVLVYPPHDVPEKTKRLYGSLTQSDMTDGLATRRLIGALTEGLFPQPGMLYNAFERVAFSQFEGLDGTRAAVARLAGRDVHLSGSGPALYCLYPAAQEPAAHRLRDTLAEQGMHAYLARTCR